MRSTTHAPGQCHAARVFAWSDLHADYAVNRGVIEAAAQHDHRGDVLIVAGDVSDKMDTLACTLGLLREHYAEVFFVPGNHEAWLRRGGFADSLEKLLAVGALCERLGVRTQPMRLGGADASAAVWIVPLLSWYAPPEHGTDSLYMTKPTEDTTRTMWADELFVRWPDGEGGSAAARLLRENEAHLGRAYDAPVVSFSHFLPRRDLMRRTPDEQITLGPGQPDRNPSFNFSRYAGSLGIDRQLRALGSRVHVYGHQHRNRERVIDGVRYVSHCLGYPGEGAAEDAQRPKLVWQR